MATKTSTSSSKAKATVIGKGELARHLTGKLDISVKEAERFLTIYTESVTIQLVACRQ